MWDWHIPQRWVLALVVHCSDFFRWCNISSFLWFLLFNRLYFCGSTWFAVHTYMRCGQWPCDSWRYPNDSMPHIDTSNPPAHGSPPPAVWKHLSSLHGSSALHKDKSKNRQWRRDKVIQRAHCIMTKVNKVKQTADAKIKNQLSCIPSEG